MSHYNEQREADEIWKNAPITATHYGGGIRYNVGCADGTGLHKMDSSIRLADDADSGIVRSKIRRPVGGI